MWNLETLEIVHSGNWKNWKICNFVNFSSFGENVFHENLHLVTSVI